MIDFDEAQNLIAIELQRDRPSDKSVRNALIDLLDVVFAAFRAFEAERAKGEELIKSYEA